MFFDYNNGTIEKRIILGGFYEKNETKKNWKEKERNCGRDSHANRRQCDLCIFADCSDCDFYGRLVKHNVKENGTYSGIHCGSESTGRIFRAVYEKRRAISGESGNQTCNAGDKAR